MINHSVVQKFQLLVDDNLELIPYIEFMQTFGIRKISRLPEKGEQVFASGENEILVFDNFDGSVVVLYSLQEYLLISNLNHALQSLTEVEE